MSQLLRFVSIAVLGLLGLAVQATAETYPERVVRIVNPYPPGGSVDVMARILAQKLADNLGQQVIVENRSGGGGNTGSDFVAKAEPDGYTLLFTAPGPLTVPALGGSPALTPAHFCPCGQRQKAVIYGLIVSCRYPALFDVTAATVTAPR